jgi:hypothetical protein
MVICLIGACRQGIELVNIVRACSEGFNDNFKLICIIVLLNKNIVLL